MCKRMLLVVLGQVCTFAVSEGVSINLKTISAAACFINDLPKNKSLPKLNVDDDGNVIMAWLSTSGEIQVALTIERDTMHWVIRPGANSFHVEPYIYVGNIPPSIMSELPKR